MKQVIPIVSFALLLATSASAADVMADGSADFETTHRGGGSTRGTIFRLGKRIRTNSSVPGVAVIMDTDAKKMWLISRACLEQNLDGDPRRTSFLISEKGAKEELVGPESVDGHPANKYKVTSGGKPPRVHYVWRAKDVKGFPLQTSDEAGTSVTTFKNVKLFKPDAKLFEPPANCTTASDLLKQLEQMKKQGAGQASPPAK